MYSGIKEKMDRYEKLEFDDKKELKKLCTMHHNSISDYLSKNEVPYAVRNALEDRLAELSKTILKLD